MDGPARHSAAAEAIAVARDIRLAELTGGAVHFAHITTAESLDLIRKAKDRGLKITCDTAPPYFDLNETAIGDYRTYLKLSPPLRGEEDRLAVVARFGRWHDRRHRSDHQPRDADDKRLPFADAAPGGAGLATLLGVTLAQVQSGHLSLAQALALLTAKPAAWLGLETGKIAKGKAADLCLFHPDRSWRVAAGQLPGKAQNTPFDGRALEGVVLGTWESRPPGLRMMFLLLVLLGYFCGSIPFGCCSRARRARRYSRHRLGQYRRDQCAAHR